MPSFFRKSGNNEQRPPNPIATPAPAPFAKDEFDIILSYENQNYRIPYSVEFLAADFSLQIYLATSVIPSRQKIIGFEKPYGPAAPLMPDGDLSKAGMFEGMQLSMTLLPVGQELEPRPLTPHYVDRIGANVNVLTQRVDAIEKHLQRGGAGGERLHKLCMFMGEAGMKLMLKVDEIDGDENVKAMRKTLVKQSNAQLDRIEKLKSRLSSPPPPAPAAAADPEVGEC
eukprot:CAMPEP_0181318838 /NCGR_PEP_ID=MMETSP1101-20121128/17225_1 /TAXON_ID=46948 /ORGANISM="Rhodomonas abbreviata, Strain Caron Lab Isolate" /LENGTH=226 /DNA_ID=CAMNT_0023426345 /DNA_START=100 /DNA_END=780 /DNA_ORIENTATION=+